ncbi:fungal specific transcription factor [Seiridium cupressi]
MKNQLIDQDGVDKPAECSASSSQAYGKRSITVEILGEYRQSRNERQSIPQTQANSLRQEYLPIPCAQRCHEYPEQLEEHAQRERASKIAGVGETASKNATGEQEEDLDASDPRDRRCGLPEGIGVIVLENTIAIGDAPSIEEDNLLACAHDWTVGDCHVGTYSEATPGTTMPTSQGRKRSRLACKTCRDLKRKCDGGHPCGTCVRFEYDCTFPETPGRKKGRVTSTLEMPMSSPSGRIALSDPVANTTPCTQNLHGRLRSLEANSGAAFLRRLALRIDANNAPRMHTFAWNAFLGTRSTAHTPISQPITEIISEKEMHNLVHVYFAKVDPIYGFINRQDLDRRIKNRWMNPVAAQPEDAVLCGVAALGYLFSNVQADTSEVKLVESARSLLEPTTFEPPSATSITAWLLRVVYLRLTDTPHKTWLASCIIMHMVEAAGLHYERAQESILHSTSEEVNPDIRNRLVAVAQHVNTWASFDTGHSRVTLYNTLTPWRFLPAHCGDNTVEILELLPYSSILDPERASNITELESALSAILQRKHTRPPSVLAQCSTLDQILMLAAKGIDAAQNLVDTFSPWHHIINVPFQVICVLLAIDTLASTPQLKGALRCLRSVSERYNTDATQEALRTASLLLSIHQKWKEKCASNLTEVLREYPNTSDSETQANTFRPVDDTSWLDDLLGDLSTTQQVDLDRLLNYNSFWESDGNGI